MTINLSLIFTILIKQVKLECYKYMYLSEKIKWKPEENFVHKKFND